MLFCGSFLYPDVFDQTDAPKSVTLDHLPMRYLVQALGCIVVVLKLKATFLYFIVDCVDLYLSAVFTGRPWRIF